MKIKIDNEWMKRWKEEWEQEIIEFTSDDIRELHLCYVAQDYEKSIFRRTIVLFGSGFIAAKYIKELKKEIANDKHKQ